MPESVFYVATHADDALMFRGEGLFSDLHTHGVTIVHVLVSAGDAGRTDGWWEARETGCVEALAGSVTPVATPSAQVTVNGHALQRHSGPGWDCYCLRLPDGNLDGNGFDATGNRTLTKLRAGQIPSLTAIDGSTTYRGWADLVATLRAVVASQRGTTAHPWINTSDPDAALNPRDHPDHYAVAAAVQDFAAADLLNRLWWVSYDVRDRVPNLAGYALDIKWFLCRLYGWAVDDLTTTPPNDREWQWWGDRSYSRAEPA